MKAFHFSIFFTRAPLPSIVPAPTLISKLSISDHAMEPETGSAKTAAKVRLCLLFIEIASFKYIICKHKMLA